MDVVAAMSYRILQRLNDEAVVWGTRLQVERRLAVQMEKEVEMKEVSDVVRDVTEQLKKRQSTESITALMVKIYVYDLFRLTALILIHSFGIYGERAFPEA